MPFRLSSVSTRHRAPSAGSRRGRWQPRTSTAFSSDGHRRERLGLLLAWSDRHARAERRQPADEREGGKVSGVSSGDRGDVISALRKGRDPVRACWTGTDFSEGAHGCFEVRRHGGGGKNEHGRGAIRRALRRSHDSLEGGRLVGEGDHEIVNVALQFQGDLGDVTALAHGGLECPARDWTGKDHVLSGWKL